MPRARKEPAVPRKPPGIREIAESLGFSIGKVYVDYLRNVRGANAVGPYSTRAQAEEIGRKLGRPFWIYQPGQ